MTSLRTRLAFALVVAALLPMSALGLLAQQVIVEHTREAHERQLEGRADSARRRLRERAEADRSTLARLCGHDLVIDGLLVDLAAGRYGQATEARMERLLPPLMASLGFEVLVVLDSGAPPGRGRVLGSGHDPERAGARDLALLASLERTRGEPFVAKTRVLGAGGAPEELPMVLGGCTIARDGAEVSVVAGRTLESYVSDIGSAAADPVRVALTGPDGALPDSVPQGGGTREVATLAGPEGEPVARVVAALDDRELDAQLAALRTRNLAVGAAAVVLALSLAGLLAIRMTRPLSTLERAAQRVGRGDLGSTVDGSLGGREIARAFEAFNEMTRELDRARARLRRAERVAAWRDIARRIAHEIKNPLSPIQVSIETMRKTKSKRHPDFDEIFEESTLMILEEVERMKRIVSEFSEFARLPRPRPSEVPLRELADHVARLHSGRSARVRVEGDEVTIRADREQLTQVFVNLVQNGLAAGNERHGERGGEVVITIRALADGGAEVTFDDDGSGVPEDLRVRIFEPYFTTRSQGTGLGLAIVHRIVDDHGGTIEIDDGPRGGARFRVRLPAEIALETGLQSAADGSITGP